MAVMIPVSIGELYDKFTIVSIKINRIEDLKKLKLLHKEYCLLDEIISKKTGFRASFFSELRDVNEKLWDVENNIRVCEKNKCFNADFIELARSVYTLNDQRSLIKKRINKEFHSEIEEVKSYEI